MKSQEVIEHQASLKAMYRNNIDRLTKEIETETDDFVKRILAAQLGLWEHYLSESKNW
jgi:hypothetical protein